MHEFWMPLAVVLFVGMCLGAYNLGRVAACWSDGAGIGRRGRVAAVVLAGYTLVALLGCVYCAVQVAR